MQPSLEDTALNHAPLRKATLGGALAPYVPVGGPLLVYKDALPKLFRCLTTGKDKFHALRNGVHDGGATGIVFGHGVFILTEACG